MSIEFIDRKSGQKQVEKVYGDRAIRLLYGDDWMSRIVGAPLLQLTSKIPFISWLYGKWQSSRWTTSKIVPFIEKFGVDPKEFLVEVGQFDSFNDFFIRKLKPDARPIGEGAVLPADGRYLFYPNISEADGFVIKGEKFCLATLLEDEELAQKYAEGTMVIARLCPSDYHRFHFPCDGVPGETKLINGWLYSVNPLALKRDINIFSQNKRTLCKIASEKFGTVLFLEVGATFVGSMTQTYQPNQPVRKGDEKGYFSFGASTVILLFEPGKITLCEDLVRSDHVEIKCLMGESLGF